MGLGNVAPAPVIVAPVASAVPVPRLDPPAPGAGDRSPDEQASAINAIAVDQRDRGRTMVPPEVGSAGHKVVADRGTRQTAGGGPRPAPYSRGAHSLECRDRK